MPSCVPIGLTSATTLGIHYLQAEASWLYYFGARYFDRGIGRWLAPDPIASEFSPYSYVHNRPLNYIDRLGLSDELPSDYDYVDVPAFMFWGTGFGGFGGGGGGGGFGGSGGFGIGAGGYWKKQKYGIQAWNDPTVWLGYDWVWVPGEGEIPVYNVDEYLDNWTRSRISRSSVIKANLFFIPGVRHNYLYIYQNSRQRGQWDLKPRLKEIFPRYNKVLYEFHGELYSYDELGNIAWGRIMAAHGIDPLTAMSAAGAYQIYEAFVLGVPKPVNLPFGDDIRDTRAIWRGYNWWRSGR